MSYEFDNLKFYWLFKKNYVDLVFKYFKWKINILYNIMFFLFKKICIEVVLNFKVIVYKIIVFLNIFYVRFKLDKLRVEIVCCF